MNDNKSNCKYWDYWLIRFAGRTEKDITPLMEKECCYPKDSTLCPDCRKYWILKGFGELNQNDAI